MDANYPTNTTADRGKTGGIYIMRARARGERERVKSKDKLNGCARQRLWHLLRTGGAGTDAVGGGWSERKIIYLVMCCRCHHFHISARFAFSAIAAIPSTIAVYFLFMPSLGGLVKVSVVQLFPPFFPASFSHFLRSKLRWPSAVRKYCTLHCANQRRAETYAEWWAANAPRKRQEFRSIHGLDEHAKDEHGRDSVSSDLFRTG